MSAWAPYLERKLREHGWRPADVDRLTNGTISKSMLSRWLRGQQPMPDNVLAVGSFFRDPVGAWQAAGYPLPAGVERVEPQSEDADVVQHVAVYRALREDHKAYLRQQAEVLREMERRDRKTNVTGH